MTWVRGSGNWVSKQTGLIRQLRLFKQHWAQLELLVVPRFGQSEEADLLLRLHHVVLRPRRVI